MLEKSVISYGGGSAGGGFSKRANLTGKYLPRAENKLSSLDVHIKLSLLVPEVIRWHFSSFNFIWFSQNHAVQWLAFCSSFVIILVTS